MMLEEGSTDPRHATLLLATKRDVQLLRAEYARLCSPEMDDLIYRFWHQSLKVFQLQSASEGIFELLRQLLPPEHRVSVLLGQVVSEGTGHVFSLSDNDCWLGVSGPVVLAFLQLRWLLSCAVWSADNLDVPPVWLPPRWAALLDALDMR